MWECVRIRRYYGKLVVGDYERVPQKALECATIEVDSKASTSKKGGAANKIAQFHIPMQQRPEAKNEPAGLFSLNERYPRR